MRTFLCVCIIAALEVCITALPTDDSSADVRSYRTCRDLCCSCGCLGFYCGEECLCECDGTGETEGKMLPSSLWCCAECCGRAEPQQNTCPSDNECIEKIHNRCERMQLQFEVLIQGSDDNRLVRSLHSYSAAVDGVDGRMEDDNTARRTKRSTYSVYKPTDNARSGTIGSDPSSSANKIINSVDTLRLVQSFLLEIGAELSNEISKKGEDDVRFFKWITKMYMLRPASSTV